MGRRPKVMKCPLCGCINHRVVDSDGGPDGTYRRTRKCTMCGVPFNTLEVEESKFKDTERKALAYDAILAMSTDAMRQHVDAIAEHVNAMGEIVSRFGGEPR